MSQSVEIIKIKVKENVPEIIYKKHHEDDRVGEHTAKDPYLIHPDFQDALDAFKPHFAKLLDLREGDIIKKRIENIHEEAFGNIKITGICVSGVGEDFGVCITGTRSFRGNTIPQTTPLEKIFAEYSDYKFRQELNECVQRIQYEAEQYLLARKHRIGQASLDFEAQAEDME